MTQWTQNYHKYKYIGRNTKKYWKTEMVVESEILSDLFQFATHQQIIVLQNNP